MSEETTRIKVARYEVAGDGRARTAAMASRPGLHARRLRARQAPQRRSAVTPALVVGPQVGAVPVLEARRVRGARLGRLRCSR